MQKKNGVDIDKESEEEAKIIKDSQEKIDRHLSKFNDIDQFFNSAEKEVLFYFDRQKKFKTLESFKHHLAETISFYSSWFSLPISQRRQKRERIEAITFDYDRLIFFSEDNLVERQRSNKNYRPRPCEIEQMSFSQLAVTPIKQLFQACLVYIKKRQT